MVGTLGDIVEKVAAAKLRPPAITIVGDVVRLRDRLRWFEERPLFGRRVVVTRPRAQAGPQIQALRDLGAEVVAFPTIRIQPVDRYAGDRGHDRSSGSYELVVFTSVNGVECFFDRLRDAGPTSAASPVHGGGGRTEDRRRLPNPRARRPTWSPSTFVAEGVLEALRARRRSGGGRHEAGPQPSSLAGALVLIPRALEAREVLPEAFAAAGAQVDIVPLYETVLEDHEPEEVAAVLEADYVTFTSASSAQHFAALLRRDGHGDALPGCVPPLSAP